jgi:hypothetical protein
MGELARPPHRRELDAPSWVPECRQELLRQRGVDSCETGIDHQLL